MKKSNEKKPKTTSELFEKICEILKQKNIMPDILDYALSDSRSKEIKKYEFDFKLFLDYGSNEGIYLDCCIKGDIGIDGEDKWYALGTFKTLREDSEAMYIMAKLYADFIMEGSRYVNGNLDDFNWTGADVQAYDETGTRKIGYSCKTKESAEKVLGKLREKYYKVVYRDNETRKETEYIKEGKKKGE